MKTVIIVASSRKNGDTGNLANKLAELSNWDLVYLNDYTISYYDYEHKNHNDDFLPLVTKLIDNYDHFVFATPVYWYAMSGILKIFLDRFTDLLTLKKDTGRKLRGKLISVITTSTGDNLGKSFWIPFQKTAAYLSMKFIAGLHTVPETFDNEELVKFIKLVQTDI